MRRAHLRRTLRPGLRGRRRHAHRRVRDRSGATSPPASTANTDSLARELLTAGDEAHDHAWHMPLWDDYQEQLKSNFADMANIGGRPAAASLLPASRRASRKSSSGPTWISPARHGRCGAAKGATGRPVPLLTHFPDRAGRLNRRPPRDRRSRQGMTEVTFYFNARTSWLRRARTAGKTFHASGRRLLIFSTESPLLATLDTLLWTTPSTGFLPHCRASDRHAAETPVLPPPTRKRCRITRSE